MIDLSGKREGYRGPPRRNYDHREIGGTAAMQELVGAGHIRHVVENNGLDMKVRPTAKQYAHIRNIADRSNGEVTLDLQDGLGEYDEANEHYGDSPRRHNVEYPKGTRADRIIRDIEAFYDGKDPPPPPEARYAAALAPEQAVERYEAQQWTEAQLEAYALGRSHALGPDQYARRKSSPGQLALFGDDEPTAPTGTGKHDVSHEPRDELGRWTAGPPAAEKPEDLPAAAVDPPASVATVGQEETTSQPKSGATTMQPLTVTIAGTTTPKQQQYIDALLERINANLQELASVAPRSTEAVAAEYRQSLTMPHTSASMMIDRLKFIADGNVLGKVYQQAERVLRDKAEKAALMPLLQAAADAFRAIPVKRWTPKETP